MVGSKGGFKKANVTENIEKYSKFSHHTLFQNKFKMD